MGAGPNTRAVLITGCSSGIGEAAARRLAAHDDLVVYATARRPDSIVHLAEEGCRTLALDVTDGPSMQAAVSAVEEEHGAVWGLVNNAGYSQSGAIESIPVERVRDQFETNVFGLLRLCQLVLPAMRQRGEGRIVNIGSMGGRLTFPGGGIYHATKYALEAISDAMRFELSGFGVDVVLIEPGLIKTGFSEAAADALETTSGGPYERFNRRVGKVTKAAYEGPLGILGGDSDSVARTIERALRSKRPKTRYPVTPSARLAMAGRSLSPDRVWDAAMRVQFPRPGD